MSRFALAAALLLSTHIAGAAPTTVEKIVAVVNSDVILLSEARDRAALLGKPIDERGGPAAERQAQAFLRDIVDKMVEDLLITQQAAELKLTAEDAEVDRALEELKRQNQLDDKQFAAELGKQGQTVASYRRDLRNMVLRQKVINVAVRSHINVSDDEVRSYYGRSARQAGAGLMSAHIRHVLIALPAGTSAEEIERRRRVAAQVIELARSGGDFAELAKTYSDDEHTKTDGGDLGWVKQGEGLSEAMDQAIFALAKPGDVSGPIRTDRGFEVIELREKKEAVRPFEDAKESIRQQLYATQLEKQTQSWLGELRKKAHVEIRL